jgi:hypothetical protein
MYNLNRHFPAACYPNNKVMSEFEQAGEKEPLWIRTKKGRSILAATNPEKLVV